MPVEWQGDHKLLKEEKEDFEREVRRMGLEPSDFLVQVRREQADEGRGGSKPIRYTIYINDVKHPDRETSKLEGGEGRNWIAEFVRTGKSRR